MSVKIINAITCSANRRLQQIPLILGLMDFFRLNRSPVKGILNTANCLDSFFSVLNRHVCIFVQRQKKRIIASKATCWKRFRLIIFLALKHYPYSFLHENLESQRFDGLQWKKNQSCVPFSGYNGQCRFTAIRKSSMQFRILLFIPKFK